jgi:Tfp pilus assembly protein PilF
MVLRSHLAGPPILWPALFLLIVTLGINSSVARAQNASTDDALSGAGRTSQFHGFGAGRGQLSGTVSLEGQGGGPASGAVVIVRSLASSDIRSAATDIAGHYEIDGLVAGPYSVTAEANGCESASIATSISRDSTEVDLSLKSLNGATSRVGLPGVVSVHELKIPSKAQDFYGKGLQHLEKDPAASVSFFSKAIEKYSNYYEAYYEMGQAQVRLNQTDEAMKSFQTAIDLSGGKFAPAEFAYGLMLCSQGKAREAERVVRHGLENGSNMVYGYMAMGVVALHLYRPEEAEKNANEVILRNPRLPDAYLILADAHAARNNYDAEAKDLEVFLKLVPEGPRSDFARSLRNAADRLARESAQGVQSRQIPQRPDVLNVQPTQP